MRIPLLAAIVAAVCAAISAPAAAATTPTPAGPPSSSSLSARDQAFLTGAGHGAQFGIAAGRLAVDRAADARIRAFGHEMVTGHGAEYQRLQSLDRLLGLTPPSAPGPEQQKVLAIWSSLRGGPFDCSYAPTIFAAHALDVDMFMVAATHADNAQVRAFADAELPVLRQHLQIAARNLTGLNCSAPPVPPSATST
jgi:putative membrane protein